MSGIANVFKKLFGLINGIRKILLNVIFFFLLGILIVVMFAGDEPILVPENGVLVVQLRGNLVEEKTWVDPMDSFFSEAFGSDSTPLETLLSDVVESIDKAKDDPRISGIHLDLASFTGGGMNKMKQVGEALTRFRESGKPIYSYGDYYSQSQYFLAAHGDNLYLNPLGSMMFEGVGGYQLYFKDLLNKLKVSTHVFKVGAYKSAVEPYTRNDMSEQAREASAELYDALWTDYLNSLKQLREIDPRLLSGSIEDFKAMLADSNEDMAQMTINGGLVDELLTREEFRSQMINLTGLDEDEKSWRKISHTHYLDAQLPPLTDTKAKNEIAIVVARGVIVDGYQRAGSIGGDSTAALLRKARLNDATKAVVLRIDSPGGSGFASEVIRQEVLELQKAGIPVIASMSSVAASGGYWIAAHADQIWAAPTTVTGSIGVFGMFFTIEDSLAHVGIYSDGYKTTEMPAMDITRPLSEGAADIVQSSIDKFYRDFVSMVAEGRDMSYDEVHEVAQGRVWTGAKAQELGLVDRLGDLDEAIAAAAELANISDYKTVTVQPELNARERFLRDLFGEAQVFLPVGESQRTIDPMKQQLMGVWRELQLTSKFNDPNGVYLLCEVCPIP
ncbi:signal peptide peptidase SppA [Pseudidiomarina sp. 1APP75-32.1]|uniref:Signal peptide peptidase SppA n=1 Tax=Pseudidiomarina terrestris TaxID=2820060 RepID=A0AAW7QXT1_9GAMM|nr:MULTISPECIES: signal peptide peptidase SppA [unclassified Pseudidiomarina]MDN7123648.1 signal peptide peptidase SppA [Pseudidiomarina sp. 1APP75-32.1]MDN7128628.1 signal peptide peptidase SppA [Pseudidiomarina sp. 1APR75-15]